MTRSDGERTRRALGEPRFVAAIAVAAALLVAAAWFVRPRRATDAETALEATRVVRVVRHGALGVPEEPTVIRDRPRVRAIVAALGVDEHREAECPQDYSSAELGITLSGDDVYARRNVYVWSLAEPGSEPVVVTVRSSGCLRGPPADAPVLRRELGSDAR